MKDSWPTKKNPCTCPQKFFSGISGGRKPRRLANSGSRGKIAVKMEIGRYVGRYIRNRGSVVKVRAISWVGLTMV